MRATAEDLPERARSRTRRPRPDEGSAAAPLADLGDAPVFDLIGADPGAELVVPPAGRPRIPLHLEVSPPDSRYTAGREVTG